MRTFVAYCLIYVCSEINAETSGALIIFLKIIYHLGRFCAAGHAEKDSMSAKMLLIYRIFIGDDKLSGLRFKKEVDSICGHLLVDTVCVAI